AWGQQRSSTSAAKDQSKDAQPVVRTFGAEGGYRTEVSSQTKGKLSEEDRRQASLLMAQVFQHIDKARHEIDADDTKEALEEVNKGREAIKAIRAMLPRTTVRTRATAPDGKVIYEDDREVQESRIPLFEGMLHTQTFAPILAARRHALEIAGVHVVEAETIATEAIADLDQVEGQLGRAAKALEANKAEDAAKALAQAQVRGVEFRYSKEDTPLALARDAIWLARRSLEENNAAQALVNLEVARLRLRVYRELLSQDQRREVDQMLREVDQLEGQLRQEGTQPISRAERARQGHTVTQWWDRVNS
ncbi:MAG: YfdX family protein, partial [Planctomycetaceae bacterium]|nr:YfdX family protein [Planctomycetaceae bacterium]